MTAAHDVFVFVPGAVLITAHFAAGFVVFAEALNKLERYAPFKRGISCKARFTSLLNCLGWMLLATGAAGAMVTPLLQLEPPTLQDCAVIVGFSILTIRSRLKEFEL